MIRLYNTRTRTIERLNQQEYVNRYLQSLNQRLNLNGRDYDVEYRGQEVWLVDSNNPANRRLLSQPEF